MGNDIELIHALLGAKYVGTACPLGLVATLFLEIMVATLSLNERTVDGFSWETG